jgi:hypothetical protein
MNIKNSYAFAGIFLLSGVLGRAQGTFQNLDFEEANVIPIVGSPLYPYDVTVANALPDWTVEYGNIQQSQMTYNEISLGAPPQYLSPTVIPQSLLLQRLMVILVLSCMAG